MSQGSEATTGQAPSGRARARDLGLCIGRLRPGPLNAITDVAGVRVGHATIMTPGARTGVTAILPHGGDIFHQRLFAHAFVLNGAGEMSGLIQVREWGLLETPIVLTNTLAVGRASQAVVDYMLRQHPGIGAEHDVVIPLVGECDDSFVNDIAGQHVGAGHVWQALDEARTGPIAEGNVGGGTGMVSFDLKGGIGTASRRVLLGPSRLEYTLGALVMSNVGRIEDLRLDGLDLGRQMLARGLVGARRERLYGSIIVVLACDAPLLPTQLERLCRRAALGLGRLGSYAANGSGEIITAFSTANVVPRAMEHAVMSLQALNDALIDGLYLAAIEATEEAVANALCAAEPMERIRGGRVAALSHELLEELAAAARSAALPQ